jgi:peptide/nickel transport system permease protein
MAEAQLTFNLGQNRTWFAELRYRLARWPIFPVVIIVVMAFAALFAPIVSPHDPLTSNLRDRNVPPFWYETGSFNHVLGADTIGRDILSRLIHGARVSLLVVTVALVTGTVVGTGVGLIAGYIGGVMDEVIMRIVDVWFGLPFILVALVIAVVIGPSLQTMMGLLALFTWPGFVRNVRAEVLTLKSRDFVSLAHVAGAPSHRILLKHILPSVLNTVLVIASLRSGQLILSEAFLSFLGAGIPPPTPTWGAMIADGRNYLRDAWWISFFPGVAIALMVMSLNFFGDWMRDHFDPRLRQL